MPTDAPVAILLMAAGASRRMGVNKLLLPLEGEPIIVRAASRALRSGAVLVVAVVPAGSTEVQAHLAPLGVKIVETVPGAMSESLHAALRALPPEVVSAVVFLSDMVHLRTEHLAAVVQAAGADGHPFVVSRYGEVSAPPIAIPRRLFAEALSRHGERIGKELVAAHHDDAHFLRWPIDLLGDLDEPADYAEARARYDGAERQTPRR